MADGFGISIPAGSLTATVNVGVRHGDLHPANVLIDNGVAVLIDFDSSGFASAAMDPVTALLSTLVHPDSPLRGDAWPDVGEIEGLLRFAGVWFESTPTRPGSLLSLLGQANEARARANSGRWRSRTRGGNSDMTTSSAIQRSGTV